MNNKTRKRGQPTKLNTKVQEEICAEIAKGNYLSTACQIAGITYNTYLNWMDWGEKQEETGGIYFDFLCAVKKAEALAESERVERIRKAGEGGAVSKRITRTKKDGTQEVEETFSQGQWLADMTHLERRHPDRWSRRPDTTISVDGNKIEFVITYEKPIEIEDRQSFIDGEIKELSQGEESGKGT